jgi:hypothetical protein
MREERKSKNEMKLGRNGELGVVYHGAEDEINGKTPVLLRI